MEKLTTSELSIRARSKRRVYNLLVMQGNLFPPPIDECKHKFIKDTVEGKKKVSFSLTKSPT